MKSKYIKTLVLAASVTLGACEKALDVQPQASLDAATAYTNRQAVDAGLIGVYSSMQSGNYWGLRYFAFADLYADNLIHVGTFPSFAQIANKQILPDNIEVQNMWGAIYTGINRANNIIAAAPNITDPAFSADQAIGEAKALRAFFYFDLLRYFGGSETGYNKPGGLGVPLILDPTLTPEDAAPQARATEAEVFTQILADLDDAIAKLPAATTVARFNKNSATALKVRVQLYREDWVSAEALATEVIANYTLQTGASYEELYSKKNTRESILELQFDPTNANAIAFFYYPTTSGGRNEISSSATLNSAHELGDVRQPINYTVAPNPVAKTRKYTRLTGDDNVILIRLAEMYLIRAEARARQNNLVDALSDLNVIRTRAGLTPYVSVLPEDILNQILQERRLEFAHEGHRWFDLRRYNQTGLTQTFRNLWPIPQREVQTSEDLIAQNPGY